MAKDTEKYKQFEIEWATLPSIPWGGHGVEFHYKGERGILIGFIEGHEWNHKNSGFCKIYTLAEDSTEWGEFKLTSNEILKELKDCIYQVLRQHRFLGFLKGNIYGWPNP
jgi:hypothetical protein